MPKPTTATMPKEVSDPSSNQTGKAIAAAVTNQSPKKPIPEKPAPLSPEQRTAVAIAAASRGKVLPPPRPKLPRGKAKKSSAKAAINPKRADISSIDPVAPKINPKKSKPKKSKVVKSTLPPHKLWHHPILITDLQGRHPSSPTLLLMGVKKAKTFSREPRNHQVSPWYYTHWLVNPSN